MKKIKDLLPYLLVPSLILLGGMVIYYVFFIILAILEPDLATLQSLEYIAVNRPDYAANCGVGQHITSLEAMNDAILHARTVLHYFLIIGTIGLFVVSVSREIYIYRKLNKTN